MARVELRIRGVTLEPFGLRTTEIERDVLRLGASRPADPWSSGGTSFGSVSE